MRIQMRALPTKARCANSPLNGKVRKHKNGTFSNKTQSGVNHTHCACVDGNCYVGELFCFTDGEGGWGYCNPAVCPEEDYAE